MKRLLADFAVLLAVVICTGVDAGFGLNTPKLYVPDEFKPSRADRYSYLLFMTQGVDNSRSGCMSLFQFDVYHNTNNVA
jgi:HCO3- transporter family